MKGKERQEAYEWQAGEEATVVIHLQDGSSFALPAHAAEKRYGVTREDCQSEEQPSEPETPPAT